MVGAVHDQKTFLKTNATEAQATIHTKVLTCVPAARTLMSVGSIPHGPSSVENLAVDPQRRRIKVEASVAYARLTQQAKAAKADTASKIYKPRAARSAISSMKASW